MQDDMLINKTSRPGDANNSKPTSIPVQIRYNKVERLPRLAWCAEVRRFEPVVEVVHGPWLETAATWFCDGAWSGDFSSGRFETSIVAGTAGKVTDDGLLLCTPNSTVDRIFVVRLADAVMASNSLAFLLARTDDDLHMRHLFYGPEFASIVEGLSKCIRSVPTRAGRRVTLFHHCNLLITPDLRLIERPKQPVKEFADFADYKSFLEETVIAIQANAQDANRRIKYPPLATISNGYDSPAAAIFARKAGCTEAVTIRQSRGGGDNSGEVIAEILGLNVTTFDRADYLKVPGFTEAENSGYPLVFASWERLLEGRVLYTGFFGGVAWNRSHPLGVSRDLVMADSGGTGFSEFRLRVGFIHLPVPFIGGTSCTSICRISNSPEMAPWQLNNGYDRPIPRRLVEEAGVPRELFGMIKSAVEVVVRREGTSGTMSEESREDFDRFCRENWNAAKGLQSRAVSLLGFADRMNRALNKRIIVVLNVKWGLRVKLPRLIPRRLRALTYAYPGNTVLLFHWAVRKLLPRYRVDDPAGGAVGGA